MTKMQLQKYFRVLIFVVSTQRKKLNYAKISTAEIFPVCGI